jgi:hypothetical protein
MPGRLDPSSFQAADIVGWISSFPNFAIGSPLAGLDAPEKSHCVAFKDNAVSIYVY